MLVARKMSLPIQIISTDFDGTIFAEFERPPIADELVALIGNLQSRGAKWVINTGRDMSSLMEALARSRISIQPDALVLVEREIYYREKSRFVGLDEWNQQCAAAHAELFAIIRADLPGLARWIGERFPATVYEDAYSPFCLLAKKTRDAEAIHDYLNEYCRNVPNLHVVRNDVYARLAHSGYDKGRSLAEIARRWRVLPENIFAAGDHLNDLPMLTLEHARWLVTNANAIEPVKETVRRQNGFISRFECGEGVAEGLKHCLELAKAGTLIQSAS
jgi:hydroxymethylpyrimidine pyrophosphatase-like HAD family hydrolase